MILLRRWLRGACRLGAMTRGWVRWNCRLSAGAANRAPRAGEREALDALLDAYDQASDENRRERVAEQIYDLVGERVRGMISNHTRRPLDELDALSMHALMRGLCEAGLTTFKRASADWDNLIAHCREGRGPVEKRVWSMLSPQLRAALEERAMYLPQTLIDAFIKEVNTLLRRRDLYDPGTFAGVEISEEAAHLLPRVDALPPRLLTRLNALLLAGALPEMKDVPRQERSLLGYIGSVVVPQMRVGEIGEAATGKPVDRDMVRVWNLMKPFMSQLQEMQRTGQMPADLATKSLPERLFLLYRNSLDSARTWYEQRITEILGEPFRLRDNADLERAQALLREHGIPETQWPRAPTMTKPFGLEAIERAIAELGGREQGLETLRARPTAQQPATPGGGPRWQTPQGQQARAYQLVVERTFNDPGHDIELLVGRWLAGLPNNKPSQVQMDGFFRSLPPDAAEVIGDVDGLRSIIQEVDAEVIRELREPDTLNFLANELGQQQATACIAAIRRMVLARAVRFLLRNN